MFGAPARSSQQAPATAPTAAATSRPESAKTSGPRQASKRQAATAQRIEKQIEANFRKTSALLSQRDEYRESLDGLTAGEDLIKTAAADTSSAMNEAFLDAVGTAVSEGADFFVKAARTAAKTLSPTEATKQRVEAVQHSYDAFKSAVEAVKTADKAERATAALKATLDALDVAKDSHSSSPIVPRIPSADIEKLRGNVLAADALSKTSKDETLKGAFAAAEAVNSYVKGFGGPAGKVVAERFEKATGLLSSLADYYKALDQVGDGLDDGALVALAGMAKPIGEARVLMTKRLDAVEKQLVASGWVDQPKLVTTQQYEVLRPQWTVTTIQPQWSRTIETPRTFTTAPKWEAPQYKTYQFQQAPTIVEAPQKTKTDIAVEILGAFGQGLNTYNAMRAGARARAAARSPTRDASSGRQGQGITPATPINATTPGAATRAASRLSQAQQSCRSTYELMLSNRSCSNLVNAVGYHLCLEGYQRDIARYRSDLTSCLAKAQNDFQLDMQSSK
jgi:hypothetical protein